MYISPSLINEETMNKRIITLLMTAIILLSLLSGCASDTPGNSTDPVQSPPASSDSGEPAAEGRDAPDVPAGNSDPGRGLYSLPLFGTHCFQLIKPYADYIAIDDEAI